MPLFWRNTMFAVGIGKAAIAGVGIALALLGIFDIAFATHWADRWNELQQAYFGPVLAIGGVVGAVLRAMFH